MIRYAANITVFMTFATTLALAQAPAPTSAQGQTEVHTSKVLKSIAIAPIAALWKVNDDKTDSSDPTIPTNEFQVNLINNESYSISIQEMKVPFLQSHKDLWGNYWPMMKSLSKSYKEVPVPGLVVPVGFQCNAYDATMFEEVTSTSIFCSGGKDKSQFLLSIAISKRDKGAQINLVNDVTKTIKFK